MRIESTGNFYSLDDIRNLTIVSKGGEHFRLADIAEIEEAYQTPASNMMRVNGEPAIGIAISTVPKGNVVDMAEAVKEKIDWFTSEMPEGYALSCIYDQRVRVCRGKSGVHCQPNRFRADCRGDIALLYRF